MSQTAEDVLGQVVVGLKLGNHGLAPSAAKAQLSLTLAALTDYFKQFDATKYSAFVTKPYEDEGWTATAVLQLRAGTVAQALAMDQPAYVEYWERNSIIRLSGWNDPSYDRGQWGLKRIGSLEGWSTTVADAVTVAIVDSGLMWRWSLATNAEVGSHEDLDGRIPGAQFPPCLWRSGEVPPADGIDNDNNGFIDDFNGARVVGPTPGDGQIGDEVGHGTMLAGVMFATPGNGLGLASPVSGFWPGIKLMPIKFFDADTRPTPVNAKQAIEYAVDNGAKVINCSWHVGPGDNGLKPLVKAIKYAAGQGVLIVASAGNDGSNNDVYPTYPASLTTHPVYSAKNVLAVHATDRRDGKPYFSNYGKESVHLGAPGVRIATTARYLSTEARYKEISGTSASAAFASIAAALVLAFRHSTTGTYMTPAQVIKRLTDTADIDNGLRSCSSSSGILNLQRALTDP